VPVLRLPKFKVGLYIDFPYLVVRSGRYGAIFYRNSALYTRLLGDGNSVTDEDLRLKKLLDDNYRRQGYALKII